MKQNTCTYIKTSGAPCQMVALKNVPYCYYHSRDIQRQTILNYGLTDRRWCFANPGSDLARSTVRLNDFDDRSAQLFSELALPGLEDAHGIQVSIANILRALATQQITERRAGILLYGLQLALQTLPYVKSEMQAIQVADQMHGVTTATADPAPILDGPPLETFAQMTARINATFAAIEARKHAPAAASPCTVAASSSA